MPPTLTHGTGNLFTLTHQSMDKGGWWDPHGNFHEGFDEPGAPTLTHGTDTGVRTTTQQGSPVQQAAPTSPPQAPPAPIQTPQATAPTNPQATPPFTGLKSAMLPTQGDTGPQFTNKPLNGLKYLGSSASAGKSLNMLSGKPIY